MPAKTGVTRFVIDHVDLTNKEIFEAARQAGHDYSLNSISNSRWALANRRTKSRKSIKGRTRGPLAQFVASHLHLDPKALTAAAQAQGFECTAQQVSKTRWNVTRRQPNVGVPPAPPKPAKRSSSSSNGHAAASDAKETQLRRLIFELGFDRARAIFDDFDHAHQRMR